jgi:CheY-like chemotaxis protein
MDIRMPILDGYEATRAIRQMLRSDAKTVPIIALSADAFEEDKKKSIKMGMNDHIAKPVDPNLLLAALSRLIKRQIDTANYANTLCTAAGKTCISHRPI